MGSILKFKSRQKKIKQERRKGLQRILFKDVLFSSLVLENKEKNIPLELQDISKSGISFQAPFSKPNTQILSPGNEIKLKFYFTPHSYIVAVVHIKHTVEMLGNKGQKMFRVGGSFERDLVSFKVLKHFIDFLYSFAELSHHDNKNEELFFL